MGQSQAPDFQPDGSNNLRHSNNLNLFCKWGLQSGAAPIQRAQTAGFGFQVVAADGITVILNVPETGFIPSASYVQLTPQAAQPAGLTEGGIWYSSVDHSYHGLDNNGGVVFTTQQP